VVAVVEVEAGMKWSGVQGRVVENGLGILLVNDELIALSIPLSISVEVPHWSSLLRSQRMGQLWP